MKCFLLFFFLVVDYDMAFCQRVPVDFYSVGVSNMMEFYTKPSRFNWNITSVEGMVKVRVDSLRNVTFVPKVNLAQQVPVGEDYFRKVEAQEQLESYISVSRRLSFYLLYAYSASTVFSRHLAVAEATFSVGHGWNITGGSKMYYWTKPIFSYTLGAEKYIGNFWITVKPYLTYLHSKCYGSVNIGIRRYFTDPLNFIHLGFFDGHSAEVVPHLDSQYLLGNQTWGCYLLWQQKLCPSFLLKTAVSFRNEQYTSGMNRNIPGVTVGINYIF
jgi:YaiO family outer membrane protein